VENQMKTIIHIGIPKTGTSTLQHTLSASRDYLSSKKILYPRNPTGLADVNHKHFIVGLIDDEKLPRHLTRGKVIDTIHKEADSFWRSLRKQVRNESPDCLVLSTESLFRSFPQPKRKEFLARLRSLDAQATIVAYVRQPAAHFASALQQHLKASHILKPLKVPSYMSVLSKYFALVGKDNVNVSLFSRETLLRNDIISDFVERNLRSHGVEVGGLSKVDEVNVTVSIEAIDIVRDFRATFESHLPDIFTKDSNLLRTELEKLDRSIGSSKPKLLDWVRDLVDYSSADCLWLRDECGIVFDDFDYARLESGRFTKLPEAALELPVIFHFEPATRRGLLEGLRETEWAEQKAERVHWIDSSLARRNLISNKPPQT
jgi:hypothetical protein